MGRPLAGAPREVSYVTVASESRSLSQNRVLTAGANVTLTDNGPGSTLVIAASGVGGGSGTVTSVGLSDASTNPIYNISGSPVTVSGTLTYTLKTQSPNIVFAGPTSGGAAQPGFRALVTADIPTGYAYSNLSGAPSIPTGANPTASVGLLTVNGAAATFMRSDGAPALDQSIAPTWTGLHTFTPSGGSAPSVIVNGLANFYAAKIVGNSTSGQSLGLRVLGGTTSADACVSFENQAGSTVFANITGAGVASGFANVQTFTQAGGAAQTWTKPANCKWVRVICIGGGGGGGGGAKIASGTISGGGAGGCAGGVSVMDFLASDLGSTVGVNFSNAATGGNGGTAQSGASGSGGAGVAGSNVNFGTTLLLAYGGAAGGAGVSGAGGAIGTGGGGSIGTGNVGSAGGTGAAAAAPNYSTAAFGTTSYSATGGGGGAGVAATPAGASGGAGGGTAAASTFTTALGGTAGATNTAGGNGNLLSGYHLGTGGGGGGNGISTNSGGNGGNGAGYGSGGGGGGACNTTGSTSGAGGTGGPAACIVISW